MGCGGASVLEELQANGFTSALGIDISTEAIRIASRYASPKVSFMRANMVDFDCSQCFEVILFSESLYYVAESKHLSFLGRLVAQLKPGGVFIVTFAQAERYQAMLNRIRQHFIVLEDRGLGASGRHLIVFRQAES
jgi:trans-aconitate methyltransferase